MGDQLKGYCARSGERKWDLNWNDVRYGEEKSKENKIMEEEREGSVID